MQTGTKFLCTGIFIFLKFALAVLLIHINFITTKYRVAQGKRIFFGRLVLSRGLVNDLARHLADS